MPVPDAAHQLGLQREQRPLHDLLAPGRDEAGVDELHPVDPALVVEGHRVLGHLAGVLVGGAVREARERPVELVAAEAQVGLGLAPDGHGEVVLALQGRLLDLALGRPQDPGVVATTQATVSRDDDVADGLLLVPPPDQERAVGRRADDGQVPDHLGDLLAVRDRGVDALLRLDDPRRRDELHGARDLLGRLHGADAIPQDAFLASSHGRGSLLLSATRWPASSRSRPRRGRRRRRRWDRWRRRRWR